MSIFVNVICALIGAIGAYLAVKKQRRDQREKEVAQRYMSNGTKKTDMFFVLK